MKIATVYLSRAQDGLEHLRFFLKTYALRFNYYTNKLLVATKGFTAEPDFHYPTIEVPDNGFCLGSFGYVAKRVNTYDYFCFLNSRSRILCDDWLAKMANAITPRIQLVGCTGSYEACTVGLNPPFPNPHIRTNAFLISRKLVLDFWPDDFPTKEDAYLFESGPNNLTRKMARAGYESVVVDINGTVFHQQDWEKSNTFRTNNQEGLMVSDKQTQLYAESDVVMQQALRLHAWGHV